MKESIKKLKKEQVDFICSECRITEDELHQMSNEQLEGIVFEKMLDIEIEESCTTEGELDTPRCSIASDVVTILSETL